MKYFISCALLFLAIKTQAQLVVTSNATAAALVSKLIGPGVQTSNPVLTCASNGAGTFISNGTTLGIDSGVMLTTGYSRNFGGNQGANNAASILASEIRNASPSAFDANILAAAQVGNSTTTSSDIFDVCKLEFDFVPQGDTIKFNYKFMSEEYPEYVCSQFNDIFGFFISVGPGYPVPKNVALVPNTNIPVTINTINSGTPGTVGGNTWPLSNCTNMGLGSPFSSFYANNSFSSNIVYDGGTVIMESKAVVVPCSTYHFKFAIADIFDGEFDSGVFMKAGSFRSESVIFDKIISPTALPINWPYSTEGCNSDTIILKRPFPKPTPQIVYLTIGGTAINGLDYAFIPATVTIPANDSIVRIPIVPFTDAITEGTETLFLGLKTSVCNVQYNDTLTILINEFPFYNVTDDDTICFGSNKILNALLQVPDTSLKFTWKPLNINAPTISTTPLFTGVYTLTAAYPGCASRDSIVKITVAPNPNINAGLDTLICNGSSATLTATGSLTLPYPITYSWSPNIALSNPSGISTNASPSSNTNYTITATNSAGCSTSDVVAVQIKPQLLITANSTSPNCTNSNGSITLNNSQGAGVINYTLMPGGLSNTTGLFSGLSNSVIYTITATNSAFCSSVFTVNLGNIAPISFTNISSTIPLCNGNSNGAITATAIGLAPVNYLLQPNNINSSTGNFSNLNANTYTIIATDGNLCTTTTIVNIVNPPMLGFQSITPTPLSCFNNNTGAITVTAIGGTGAINYNLNGTLNNSTGLFPNLSSSIYTVQITDANNCTSLSTINITQPSVLVLSTPTITPSQCVPANSGGISVTTTGGNIGGFTYTLSNASGTVATSNTGIFANLLPTSYTVLSVDAKGCSATTIATINAIIQPVWNNTLINQVACFGNNTGNISGSILNGTAPINYTISPNLGSNLNNGTYNNLTAGNYTIIATDNIGCSTSSAITITQPTLLNFSLPTLTHPTCNSFSNGNITLTGTGGAGNYTYQFNNIGLFGASNSFTNLQAGTFTITVKDANQCTNSVTYTLTQPFLMTWQNVSSNNISCFNGGNGSINSVANGGTAPLSYELNMVQNNSTGSFTNLFASVYTIVAEDVNGCSLSTLVAITQAPDIILANANITIPSCNPGGNGTITQIATGGTGIISYNLNNGSGINQNNTTGSFTNLIADTYTITATDANGCFKTKVITVNAPNNVSISSTLSNETGCSPNNTGSIVVTASGGNSPLQYNINGGTNISTGNFSNLIAGNYTVTVSDNLNCSTNTIVNVSTTLAPSISTIATTISSCIPSCNGTAGIGVSGGTGNLVFSNGSIIQNSSTFQNLCPATYTATVTDANGCTTSQSFIISIQPNPSITNVVITNVLCNSGANGSISYSGSGGTTPYLYNLNGGTNNATGIFPNLGPATYTISVQDFYGCTTSSIAQVIQPSTININSITLTHPLCNGAISGSIAALASGGFGTITYSITGPISQNNTTGTFTNLAAGNYVVIATDANNCSVSSAAVITQPTALTITNINIDSATCYNKSDGSFSISVSGGTGLINYLLAPNPSTTNPSFVNLAGGNYALTISDANNCTLQTTISIPQPTPLQIQNLQGIAVTCNAQNNGIITASGIGGELPYIFTLNGASSNSTANYTSLVPNTYTLQISDAYNCTRSSVVNITEPAPLVFTQATVQNVLCNGGNTGSITTTTSGGNSGQIFSINPSVQNPNSSGIFNNLAANNFTITVTDSKNCTSTTAASITQAAAISILANYFSPKCAGSADGNILAQANGGAANFTYTLLPAGTNNTSGIFSNLTSGTYQVIAKDANNCNITTNIILTSPVPVQIDTISINPVVCFGQTTGTATVTANGGTGNFTYLLLPNNIASANGIFQNLAANIYTVQAIDGNNCISSTFLSLQQNPALVYSSIIAINPKCSGIKDGNISVIVNGGLPPYQYALNSGIFTNLNTWGSLALGNYTIVTQDAAGCTASTLVVLNEPLPLTVAVDSVSNTRCNSQKDGVIKIQAQFGNIGTYTYLLKPTNLINNTGLFTGLSAGIYSINVTDSLGCSGNIIVPITNSFDSISIAYNFVLESCTTLGNNGIITAIPTGGTPEYTYLWSVTGQTTNVLDSISAGLFTLEVTDKNGCKVSDTVSLPPPPCCQLYIPNVFTPNGDGKNETFAPIGAPDYEIQYFEIFDRWGNKVFSTNVIDKSWDGNYKNSPLDIDTYFYHLKYKCNFTQEIIYRKGDIQLAR